MGFEWKKDGHLITFTVIRFLMNGGVYKIMLFWGDVETKHNR